MKISEIKRKGYVPEETIYYDIICRTIAAPVAKLFMVMGFEANTVTLGMIALGVASGVALGFGWMALGIVLMHLFLIVDASDGYIAKAKERCTLTGLYLDHLGHYVCHPAFIVGMAVALYRAGGGPLVLVAGGLAAWANVSERALRDTYNYVLYKNICGAGLRYALPSRERGTSVAYKVKSFLVGMMDFPFILNIFTVLYIAGIWSDLGLRAMIYVMTAYGVILPLYLFYAVLKVFRGNRLDRVYSDIVSVSDNA